MKFSLIPISCLLSIVFALPVENAGQDLPIEERAPAPTVTIAYPAAKIIGGAGDTVETFAGIPFAKPPVGPLRLKPPQPITSPLGTIKATTQAASCPQFYFSDTINDAVPTAALGLLLNTPGFQKVLNAGEDCLYLNIQRPAGTTASSKLPVLFWIFGGGFQFGGTESRLSLWQWRIGLVGFGFLPGAEVLADGSANLGLLDQRLGLQWVADNIAAFGGDPSKVTIWGDPPQLFFRSAIIPSASDGKVLTQSPDLLLSSGAWAKVPFIIGDQEDEGTIFALFQSNISTTAQIATYLSDFFFHNAPASVISGLLDTYPNNLISGSPFRTLILNNWYPQFKRLAAILGDLTFTLTRRVFLQIAHEVAPDVPPGPTSPPTTTAPPSSAPSTAPTSCRYFSGSARIMRRARVRRIISVLSIRWIQITGRRDSTSGQGGAREDSC
ncbi:hypothetical protein EYC84_000699 [Monilinia fructicola]|uniref:Carboxylesterase type B domain-containing protein n=1 Tax=Monilinia fructicola TaxID=38448 RepID=A0A5M9JMP4_MONFR|nr:hypothetical protein EYC84_000699 [Monilinia fructicola]